MFIFGILLKKEQKFYLEFDAETIDYLTGWCSFVGYP